MQKEEIKTIVDSIHFNVYTSSKSGSGFFNTVMGKAVIGAIVGASIPFIFKLIAIITKKNKKATPVSQEENEAQN